ncbi:MAG: ABC transporter permease [Ignavibacteria bacterium]|nr:ABC transporter permease [Ignavibacteria bacterium]
MNYKLFIAGRFLFSKGESKFISFITYISIIGVTLGVAALIIAVSVLNGFEKEIRDKVAGLVSHIQITSFLSEGLSDHKEVIPMMKNDFKEIKGISPIVQKEAVIRFKTGVEGIILKGIVPETDLSKSKNKIISGSSDFTPVDSIFSKLLIGDKLAKKLGIEAGNKVIVFGLNGIPGPFNQPKLKQFIVSGIYETGLKELDDIIIYTDIKTTQKLFEYGENVSGIEIELYDIDNAELVVNKIKTEIGYPYYPKSLFRLYKPLFTWVELQKAPIPIVLGLIILVATFNIVGTLLMLVLEKTQSIGVLKTLGVSKSGIVKIFLYDGLLIGIIGIILGNILGLGICFLEMKYNFFALPEIYYMKSVPILLNPDYIIFITVITFILTITATLIPSFLASKLDPVKSIRFS